METRRSATAPGPATGGRVVSADPPLIAVVDDDESVRESLPCLLRALGFRAETFASGEAFLASEPFDRLDCLILDITMPGMSGPEVQQELARRGARIPIIFITAHTYEAVPPGLIGQGAVDFLFKPFSEEALLAALDAALLGR